MSFLALPSRGWGGGGLCEKIMWVHMCDFLGGESMDFCPISEGIYVLNRLETTEVRRLLRKVLSMVL